VLVRASVVTVLRLAPDYAVIDGVLHEAPVIAVDGGRVVPDLGVGDLERLHGKLLLPAS